MKSSPLKVLNCDCSRPLERLGSAFSNSHIGLKDDCAALVGSLKVCIRTKDLHRGTKLHDDILEKGFLKKCSDTLVTMYANCGDLGKAKALLDMHNSRDVITWTAMISGYVRAGNSQNALDCFDLMKREGVCPNEVTYTCALKACATVANADRGKEIHDEIVRQGLLQGSITLSTALVNMYAKCGAMSKAQGVLQDLPSPIGTGSGKSVPKCTGRDVIAWTALIAGYVREGQAQNALECFDRMQREGITPNGFTYACVLKACGAIGAVFKGKEIHDEILRLELLQNDIVLSTALVDMYAKCGALSRAQTVLDNIPVRTVASWNALIGGYAQEGHGEQALSCFEQMQSEGTLPDAWTYACALKACALLREFGKGKEIHEEIERKGLLHNNSVLVTAVVDFYSNCGDILKAHAVLDKSFSREVAPWNALMAGYAQEDRSEKVLECYAQMQREGVCSDAITWACALKACSILGRMEVGKEIHNEIVNRELLQDNLVLGAALIDMYAKCGALTMAQLVLEEFPLRNVIMWSALITGYALKGKGKQVLNCFENMKQEGILPNEVTFVCVLTACSHLGLVEEGHSIFRSMTTEFDLKPNFKCYMTMIDLFGRAGHLEKAAQLISEMPSADYSAVWLSLLASCKKWGDVKVAGWAFEQAVQLDKSNGPAYVLMANIYAAAGMPQLARDIEALSIKNHACEKPGHRWSISSSMGLGLNEDTESTK